MTRFIAYRRVSTRKQDYGLDAQERDINLFLSQCDGELIETFTDVQSGKDNTRPELAKAIDLARSTQCPLLVAKLDRLSRRMSFIARILDDDRLRLTVACMPNADKFQLHIYAALAEQEREFISARTKAGLAAAKARGVKLGNPRLKPGTPERAAIASSAARDAADQFAAEVAPYIKDAKRAGARTLDAIARALTARGVKTRRGGRSWTPAQVSRVMQRI